MRYLKNILSTAIITGLASLLSANQVKLNVAMAKPFIEAGQKQTAFFKIGLTGFDILKDADRTPVNVAIVLDRSGSMSGQKLEHAKQAAIQAVDRLSNEDIVSVITYNHKVNVLIPATKISDKNKINQQIKSIQAGGNTALFAGISKGAAEVRKFLDKDRVNRVILLSDGKANSGPSSPKALGDLGASLIKEGISVTTLGLGEGYNEDLMNQLARRSDGNHTFIESPSQLVKIFNAEFGDILSVVAQEVAIEVECADGIRPIRVLNREAEISGNNIVTHLNQLYSLQEKYLLVEVEVPSTAAERTRGIANVSVSYANMLTRTTDELASSLSVRFTESTEIVQKNTNQAVMVSCVLQKATDANKLATNLRDQGKVEEAKKVLVNNGRYLESNAARWESKALGDYAIEQRLDLENLDDDNKYNLRRKQMRASQFKNEKQQSY